jgi:hypothetical protein
MRSSPLGARIPPASEAPKRSAFWSLSAFDDEWLQLK